MTSLDKAEHHKAPEEKDRNALVLQNQQSVMHKFPQITFQKSKNEAYFDNKEHVYELNMLA